MRVLPGTPNKTAVLDLFVNGHSVYATTLDKFIIRLKATEDGFIVANSLDLKNAAAKGLGVSDDLIYVLKSNNEID